jgi:hypothetical protein
MGTAAPAREERIQWLPGLRYQDTRFTDLKTIPPTVESPLVRRSYHFIRFSTARLTST